LKKEKAEQLVADTIATFLGLGYTKEELQELFQKAISKL